jgi:hypothetical protein
MNKLLREGGVCSETNVVSNIIWAIIFDDMCIKRAVMCRVCDVTCTIMVNDFYVRSVLRSDKQQIVFITINLIGLHVLVGSIQCHRSVFFASIKVLQNHNVYSKVRVLTDDNVVILLYSLFQIIYNDGYSVFLMVKECPVIFPLSKMESIIS